MADTVRDHDLAKGIRMTQSHFQPTNEGSLPDWHPSRRRFLSLAALAAAGGAAALAGCSTNPKGVGAQTKNGKPVGRSGTAGDALFIAGFQWGPVANFNPLSSTPGWPAGQNSFQLLYETLVRFNLLNGKLEPGLASKLETPDEKTIKVTMQKGIKFSDGKPMTVDDVVNTFTLAKRNSGLSYSNVWEYITDVTPDGDDIVTFSLNPKNLNPNEVKGIIAATWILPKHVWDAYEKAGTLQKATNLKPVGSGPYSIEKFDQTQIILSRNDDYWGKDFYGALPAPKQVIHPIFKDNSAGDLALKQGKVDVSQQFTPQVWKMWESGAPISTWMKKKPYHIPGSIPFLWMNIHKKGMDNVKVRQAIAHCINYKQIAQTAMSNDSITVNSSVILPSGAEQKYYDADNVKKYGWTYDTDKAISILEDELKCKKGNDGIYRLPDGTRLGPWTAITPTGWSDWQAALQIVSSSAKAIGIDVRTDSPQSQVVTTRMQNGNFEMACWGVSGVGPASPWSRFHDLFESRGVPAMGKTAYFNYNRFSNPDVPALLDGISEAGDDVAKLKELYGKLDIIYMQNLPVIGLMYRPLEFYEYNASTWTNFPNINNPYAPPQFSGAGTDWLFKIKKNA